MMRRLLVGLIVFAGACGSSTSPSASVRYYMDAPLCGGGKFAFVFKIDGVTVGADSLRDKGYSQTFPTAPGVHEIGTFFPAGFRLADTTVTIGEGELFTRRIDFYCS